MAGHLFIVHGDLRRLACDAWLVPTDGSTIEETWQLPERPVSLDGAPPSFGREGPRTFEVAQWPMEANRPWPTLVGGDEQTPAGWFVAGAEAFVREAAARLRGRAPAFGRERHLLALPLVGTGGGGGASRAGEVLDALLPAMDTLTQNLEVDVALVTWRPAAFAAAQARREDHFEPLNEVQRRAAEELAHAASAGNLVVFMGAGVGRAAGLPLWSGLISALADRAGLEKREGLERLDPRDQAKLLQRKLGEQAFIEAVQSLVRSQSYGLPHAHLATLPLREYVTTNYDETFELASRAVGEELAILPYEPTRGRRWLLKMHGCVSRPETIVITRDSFIRYEETRSALAGIVQAMLITRHMLFVGFSLKDDDFHRIVDAVRRASLDGPQRRVGTAIALHRDEITESLWYDDLDFVPMLPRAEAGSEAAAGRRLEIFLDYLVSRADLHTAHLLADEFQSVLSPGERELAQALRSLSEGLSEAARSTAAWRRLTELLGRLGERREGPDRATPP